MTKYKNIVINGEKMTTKHSLEFANFICRFGDNLVLLDLLEEIIIPAFTDEHLQRSYRDTSFFFMMLILLS
ncbi:MAG: hypothetical protein AB4041_17170 [Microcystaceae cyanobacterium]